MAKSTRGARRGVRGDVMEMWQAPKQALPVQVFGILLRWRAELFLAMVLLVAVLWLSEQLGSVGAWCTLAGTALLLTLIPATRWFFYARFWCLLDRHRIRTALRNAKYRTMTLDGSYPFMLWARPTRTGERVYLWTRAGSSSEDIENVLDKLAPACFAGDARLHTPRRSLSTLVVVEIIRRDPLDRSTPVDTPLSKIVSLLPGARAAEGTEPITAATVTLPRPRPAAEQTATVTPAPVTEQGTKRPAKRPTDMPTNPSVVVNGEDLSDYID